MSTCHWLDLQTLGPQPIMPENLPNHWLHMNKLSLRNNRLKFKIARKLPITLEESIEYTQINEGKLEDVNM
jgi:hypothetical protein